MTATERVARTQRLLGGAAIVHALGWGLAIVFGILGLISFAALLFPGFEQDGSAHFGVALAAGAIVTAILLWRSRHFSSRNRVALWIEERVPGLQYSLITAMEHASSPFSRGMEARIESENVGGATLNALRKTVGNALGALAIGALLLYVSPSAVFGRAGLFPRLGAPAPGPKGAAGNRLATIRARVTPPPYTREQAELLADPTSISGLAGSSVVVQGQGAAAGISAFRAGAELRVLESSEGWSISFIMPAKPAAVTLKDRNYERIVILDPHADAPPKIALISPTKDTTLRAAQLVIHLNAAATDDIGLRGAYFEYLVTTGSGEVFNARTITTPIVNFDGSRRGSLAATLDLASLKLNQGDVVSIRAIAQDGNTLSGPGTATSDTRTFPVH
jgi:hypothetical protein